MNIQKSITAALIGEPNAGKSTLLNLMVGQDISIVTHKVQTTRDNIRGILTEDDVQMVFVDTPGLFDAKRTLERAIVKEALSGIGDAEVVCVLFDVLKLRNDNCDNIFKFIKYVRSPIIAILNKSDLIHRLELLPLIQKLDQKQIFAHIVPVSGLKGENVDTLKNVLKSYAKEAMWMYDQDALTDAPIRKLCEEATRQQAFIMLHQELPYSLKVETEKWDEDENFVKIYQAIFVTKESHKVIALGKGGAKIKMIGIRARKQMEELIGKKVNLQLYVKVREDWIERDFS